MCCYLFSIAQDNPLYNCEETTYAIVNEFVEDFSNDDLDDFEKKMYNWKAGCGISEVAQRLILLKRMLKNEPIEEEISVYLDNDLYYKYRRRVTHSNQLNFGYIYSDNEAYWGFVPFNHPIDSLVKAKSEELLKKDSLSLDEELLCILFSERIKDFEEAIKNRKYKDSFIRKSFMKSYRESSQYWLSYSLYTGYFKPLGTEKVFSYSPIIGLTFKVNVHEKWYFEVGGKVRVNINDKSFEYFALDSTNIVNSESSICMGAWVGRYLVKSEKLNWSLKSGFGYEAVETGISEKINEDETKSHDIETVNWSVGSAVSVPVFRKAFIGVGFNYHFCPYNLDKNLQTKLNQHLYSVETFFRF